MKVLEISLFLSYACFVITNSSEAVCQESGNMKCRNINLGYGDLESPNRTVHKCSATCVSLNRTCDNIVNNTDCGQGFMCCTSTLIKDRDDLAHVSVPNYLNQFDKNNVKNISLNFRESRNTRLYQRTDILARKVLTLCQGMCITTEHIHLCENPFSNSACGEGKLCCLPNNPASNTASSSHLRSPLQPLPCPGTCMSFFLSFFCDQVAAEYYCPDNGRCCISRRLATSYSAVPCLGSCLPLYLRRLCTKPFELSIHTSNCLKDSVCCQKTPYIPTSHVYFPPQDNPPNKPINAGMHPLSQTHPTRRNTPPVRHYSSNSNSQQTRNQFYPPGSVLPNHQVFIPIGPNGHILPSYNAPNTGINNPGEHVVLLDGGGAQSVSRQPVLYPDKNDKFDSSQYYILPNGQIISSGASSHKNFDNVNSNPTIPHNASFHRDVSPSVQGAFNSHKETFRPDQLENKAVTVANRVKEEEIPQYVISATTVVSMTETKPPCPGSCISSFLRFTCFGQHTLYPGFHCPPGRMSICCATLDDIQKREEELKAETSTKGTLSTSPTITPTMPPAPNITCGIKGTRRRETARVVGGFDSVSGEWCWQVAVINSQSQYVCGGALIDRQWILTAAHCVMKMNRNSDAIFIRAGEVDLTSPIKNPDAQTMRVATTYIHHNHNSETLDNDIALLKLQSPVHLSKSVCLVCLPDVGVFPQPDKKCTVTGYGFLGEDGPIALRVRHADVRIIKSEECAEKINAVSTSGFTLPLNSFCAGGIENSDSCQGDGGGPLVCEMDHHYELSGIVSWGLGCGRKDVPGIYARVSSFMGWMNQIISVNST